MKTKFISLLLGVLLLVSASAVSAITDGSGAVWTTNNNCGDPQNVNQYNIGDKVFINGAGFAAGDQNWSIMGLPSSCDDPNVPVASGVYTVGPSGSFCFEAYTVADDDCGVYKAEFDGKHDNYKINEPPIIPEFGFLAGMLTLVSSAVILFFVRRK